MTTRSDQLVDETFYRQTLSQLLDGRIVPNALTRSEVNRFMRIAKEKDGRDHDRITALVQAGFLNRARRQQRSYINSFHARLMAANRSTRVPGGDPQDRFPIVFCRAKLIGFDAQAGNANVWQSRKAGGGMRIKTSFGDTDLAQQRLLAKALLPFFGNHPGQYGQRGKDLAVRNLRAHVDQAGSNDVFVHADVVQFYDNLSQGWLRNNAPLPASLVSWLFYSGYTVSTRSTRCQAQRLSAEALQELARRGLPQGSALSPTIAELAIAGIIKEVGPLQTLPLVNYSDNFGMVCPADGVERLEQTLREGFASHPAGPFRLTISKNALRQENRFLGYSFRRTEQGRCSFWVREDDWNSRVAFYRVQLEHCPVIEIPDVIMNMESYFRAWPEWTGRETARLEWERAATIILQARGCEHLIPAGYAEPVEYQFGDIEASMREG